MTAPQPTRKLPSACPRCGRTDFRTASGRAWHLYGARVARPTGAPEQDAPGNAPDCRRYVDREKHSYAKI